MSGSRLDESGSSGISRRKTGCWTCRIRRKRCDEIPDDEGRCQECVRLKIPCAGWGEKRPEWTKDEETLRIFKERIKKQLMSRAPSRPASSAGDSLRLPVSATATDFAAHNDRINDEHDYPEYVHSFPTRGPQPQEMFDYPGFAARLFTIAQAAQLPHEFMTFVVQIAELEQWKALQDSHGTLSFRELARRGQSIERVLLSRVSSGGSSATQNTSMTSSPYGGHNAPLPSQPAFASAVAQLPQSQLIFMDACLFMLHSVVSGPNPRVPELAHATRSITNRFNAIPMQQRTTALIFPLCIAGVLAENNESQYIQAQIGSLGASPDLVQAVNGLIVNVGQSRWTHDISNANPLMN